MRSRQFATVAAMCGAVALASWVTPRLGLDSLAIEDAATPINDADATGSVISLGVETRLFDVPFATRAAGAAATPDPASTESASVSTSTPAAETPAAETPAAETPAAETPVVEAPLLDSRPAPQPEKPVQLAVALPSDGLNESPRLAEPPFETRTECHASDACVDDYLWSLYERTPKVDTNKETERVKKTVKKKGKMRTVFTTITKYVVGDFTWKDPNAAEKAGMPVKDYVIGGMDRGFKRKLYRALRAMEDAGFMPGITSAFRDDYRQAIATGNKAASDSSYHGGSRRGGFGHGLAADLVSVKGETRTERYAASDELWKWIDAHEQELGIGRPYRDRDPPHVGAIDGKEYVEKRALANVREAAKTKRAQTAKLQTKKHATTTARGNAGAAKRAAPEKPSKVSNPRTRVAAQR